MSLIIYWSAEDRAILTSITLTFLNPCCLLHPSPEVVEHELVNATDLRLFYVASALEMGWSVDRVHDLTRIDRYIPFKLFSVLYDN